MSEYEAEIEAFIREAFEDNYEQLRMEGAGALAPDVKETALREALVYWRKMRDVAERVTDTEVQLSLPGQETAKGREFAIKGIVDIVRDEDRTIMYDIKTHDADDVRANLGLYEEQLNVYAHIWQRLRGQPLDEAGIIATKYPARVKDALASQDERRIDFELGRWEPLVPIAFDPASVEGTIEAFGEVVDAIEDGVFAPRPVEALRERLGPRGRLFATRVCQYCDARFSCSSYRRYALEGLGRTEQAFQQYYSDLGTDVDREGWQTASLDAARDEEELERDFSS